MSRCASPDDLSSMLQRKSRIHRLQMQPSQTRRLLALLSENPRQVYKFNIQHSTFYILIICGYLVRLAEATKA